MKKLGKLKLNILSQQSLENREMNVLKGGNRCCTCSCYYANDEGYSVNDNRGANYKLGDYGGHSSDGCRNYVACEGQEPKFIPFDVNA